MAWNAYFRGCKEGLVAGCWAGFRREMALWYYGESGRQIGPLDETAIRSAIAEGRVNPQTLVWREGMAVWQPLGQTAELASAYSPVAYANIAQMGGIVRTSGLATASLVCGILGLTACFVFTGIPAVICGHMALNQINSSPIPMGGRGMAIAGLVMGYIPILACLVFLVIILVAGISSNF